LPLDLGHPLAVMFSDLVGSTRLASQLDPGPVVRSRLAAGLLPYSLR
jgi:class 3 adenylate cyclase